MKKRWAVILLAGFLLASCAGIPQPESETDSLVGASFILDFPDGFFGEPARTEDANIRLDFFNVSRQKAFTVVTGRGGWFTFLGTGGDRYELRKFGYNVEISGKGRYRGQSNFDYRFMAGIGCVQYLGHFRITYRQPKLTATRGEGTGWTFEVSSDRTNRSDEMREYLQATAKDSPWVSRELKSDFPAS